MLTISGRAVGSRRPLFADWAVPLPPRPGGGGGDDGSGGGSGGGGGGFTLRDLIALVVRAEVAAFRDRQEKRRLEAVLSAADIAGGAEKGRIDPGGRDLGQTVDEDAAVAAALTAFEDGLYLVALDGEEQRDLDKQIFPTPDSRVTFVRLVMLAGG